mmetsp:Transcript_27249/g.27113  ORF Transcript_27249/g.27113 Transcript_27249/m.27113 type:complete len:118 (-) Transcript_27249:42-395(-)
MTNSESDPKSGMNYFKSPSRMDSLSIFESSPMLKRVKLSEEEEKVLKEENPNPGETSANSSTGTGLRKSKRKRRKSKILREATGEDEIIPPKLYKRVPKPKIKNEICKILELDEAAK